MSEHRDPIRGTGRTTIQMQNAPLGSIYVWCNQHLSYPRDLARYLNRDDLEIVSIGWLDDPSHWCGRELTGIEVDHAAEFRKWQYGNYLLARQRIRS